ncbi:MAG: ABC transporter permease [Alphaproteobacteria bacterium]|nr:ABC transporter permease [Alphaproteobacteria bacterium]
MITLFDKPDNVWELIANGLPWTLTLAASSLAIGFVLAVGLALLRLSPITPLRWAAWSYVYFFRSTPLLVQIFLIYYGLGQFEAVQKSVFWPLLREAHWCAILALTLNTTAYTSEIIRGGLQAVPWGQVEAAKACGMSVLMRFRRVVFPQAIRQALPGYGNEIVLMVKSTSLASTITLLEMTLIARKETSATFTIEPLFVAAVFYLAINFLATRGVMALEYKLSPDLRDAKRSLPLPDQEPVAR